MFGAAVPCSEAGVRLLMVTLCWAGRLYGGLLPGYCLLKILL